MTSTLGMTMPTTLGQVISFTAPKEVHKEDVTKALAGVNSAYGLDLSKYLPGVRAKTAFSRAAGSLSKGRHVCSLGRGTAAFQFTRVNKKQDGVEYDREAVATLTDDGKVKADDAEIQYRLQDKLDHFQDVYTSSDIKGMIERAYAGEAALVPMKKGSGFFFVPDRSGEAVEAIRAFLMDVGGETEVNLHIGEGAANEESIRQAFIGYFDDLLDALDKATEAFSSATRKKTRDEAALKIAAVQAKIDVYSDYLGAAKSQAEDRVEGSKAKLSAKLREIALDLKTQAEDLM